MRPAIVLAGLLVVALAQGLAAQKDSVLAHRWVGMHLRQPLQFEFYGDTMLIINDEHVLDFRLTDDSLVALGDTTVHARYRLALGRLLLETPNGVVTMATQSPLARPLTGRWQGPLGTEDGATLELVIRVDGTARWRQAPDGRWMEGEWDRETRIITFTWVDESEWRAHYDPIGNAILFEQTLPGAESSIVRRIFR
jgi:hypothetical protein